jgi:hypothetical protein
MDPLPQICRPFTGREKEPGGIQAKGEPVAFDSVADTPKAVAKFIFDLSTVVERGLVKQK